MITDRYIDKIYDMYIKTHPNVDPNKARSILTEYVNKSVIDIPCTLHNNMTEERIETSMISTFGWIEQRKPIISGNGSFFKQHAEELSPNVVLNETNMKNRDVVKKQMYQFEKHSVEYDNKNIGQNTIKRIMNSGYGGSATPYSKFYSMYVPPAITSSARIMITALICCLELCSGNTDRWSKFTNVNELYDYIDHVINDDTPRTIPHTTFTVDEVANRLYNMTNDLRLTDIKVLKQVLSSYNEYELTKLMLAFNIKYVLKTFLSNEIQHVVSYLKNHQLDFDNITKESLFECGFGNDIPPEIETQMNHICKTVMDCCIYNYIPNDCETRAHNMKRIIVCVTDTDSLMVHFASYVNELQTASMPSFRAACITASAFGMRMFIENIIPRFVEYIALGNGIQDEYYRNKFIFKNEYGFLTMALVAKKMYASSMFVQEGNPRDVHDSAITGMSFKKRDAAEFLEDVMVDLYDRYVLTSESVNIEGLMDEFYALRENIVKELATDATYHKVLSIKEASAYAGTPPAQVKGAIIWNHLMPDEQMLPMDRVRLLPISYKLMHENTDKKFVSEILSLLINDDPKEKKNPVICIPAHYKTIPEWTQPIIDKEFAIDKLLSPFKQMFSLFDITIADTPGGMIPSRMIYI